MAEFDPIAFLTAQVEKMERQLAAEKKENTRLWAAVAHLQRGVGHALGYAQVAKNYVEAPNGADDVVAHAKAAIAATDNLLVPTAEEDEDESYPEDDLPVRMIDPANLDDEDDESYPEDDFPPKKAKPKKVSPLDDEDE